MNGRIRGGAASIFLLTVVVFSASVFAGYALGEQAASSLDALEKANRYSFSTGGVGIVIGYGQGNGGGVTASVIGDQFVHELARRGIASKYFFYDADWQGMTVEYHIGYSALGPWGVDEAAKNIGNAVNRAQAAARVSR